MISIVITTYNGEKYIVDQLESILNQKLKDFEIIVVDDVSTDNTVELITKYFSSNNFTNYQLIKNDKNIGATCSFEKGVINSNGDYISFCDQDDVWMSKKLESLKIKIEKGSYDLVYSQSLILKEETKTTKLYPRQNYSSDFYIRLQHNNARGATMLVRREFLMKLIPFSRYDLYDKWIYFNGLIFWKVGFSKKPLDYYRTHSSNVVGTQFHYRKKEAIITRFNSKVLFYNDLKSCLLNNDFLNDEYVKVLEKIIRFNLLVINNLEQKKFINAIKCFWELVLFEDYNLKEKFIYLYYLVIK